MNIAFAPYTPYSPNRGVMFNASTRIGGDITDLTQQNIQNMQLANASTTHYFSPPSTSGHLQFMVQTGLAGNGKTGGNGVGLAEVVTENSLFWKTQMARESGRLMLEPRTYVTVPFMGKGSVNPDYETSLQRGEYIRDKKTGQPIGSMAALHLPENYPINRPISGIVEDNLGLEGWHRGGVSTRAE